MHKCTFLQPACATATPGAAGGGWPAGPGDRGLHCQW